ncbi:MAG TPA: hypothetical protein VEW69_11400 [Alphaproteobacteria bacterium]|nr:hypothetical protein [Alphaproteobacteria bacterium]
MNIIWELIRLTSLLMAAVAILILRRKLIAQLPFFFSYTVYAVISSLLRFLSSNNVKEYFYVYWTTEAIYAVLSLLAIHEAFYRVFRNFYGLRWFRLLLPGVILFLIVMVVLRSAPGPQPGSHRVIAQIISLKIAVSLLQVGILGLFLLLVWFFHMRWRQYEFGIALGFGVTAVSTLALYLLRSEIGTKFNQILQNSSPIAYIIAVMTWLAFFAKPVNTSTGGGSIPRLTPEEMVVEFRRYTEAVKGIWHQ